MAIIKNPLTIVQRSGGDNKFAQLIDRSITTVTADDLADVTSIGSYAFYSCNDLTNVTIPDNVTSIGSYAFNGCGNLTNITIPNSVNIIGTYVFANCSSLTNVTYQGQVPNINSMTFQDCNAITKYDFRNCTTVPTLASTTSLGHASGCQIIIPDDLYDTWVTASVWSNLTDVTFVKASEYIE